MTKGNLSCASGHITDQRLVEDIIRLPLYLKVGLIKDPIDDIGPLV